MSARFLAQPLIGYGFERGNTCRINVFAVVDANIRAGEKPLGGFLGWKVAPPSWP